MSDGAERADSGVVIFAGGGTGGHLYPALAIAEQLQARARSGVGPRCEYICSDRPLDADILTKAGAVFTASCAKPLAVRPVALARFLRTWGRAVKEARGILRAAKARAGEERVVMVAMGGFVAAPAAQAARVERVPILLVNLDAVPGKANRFVAWRARSARGTVVSTIPVRGDSTGGWPVVGPIVRSSARSPGTRDECCRRLGLDRAKPVLMVTGGSQGAKSINSLMVEPARREAALFQGWQVVHQCGKGEAERVRAAYVEAGMRAQDVRVAEFVDSIGEWWGAADLAVSRSGAGSVAEAWANRVPCVFLPYPYHKDEHQRWNAEPLLKVGACVMERDQIDPGANASSVGAVIAGLMRDEGKREAMRAALGRLGGADGAAEVAARVAGILGG